MPKQNGFMQHLLPYLHILSMATLVAWTGCTYTHSFSSKPLEPLAAAEKLPLRTVLILSEGLCTYTHRYNKSRSLNTWVYPLGKPLCRYAESVVQESFAHVVVVPDRTAAATQETDVMVMLRLIAVLVFFPDFPRSLVGDQENEIILEWTVLDRTGQTVWTHTEGGIGRAKAGDLFTRAPLNRKAMQQALDDVFAKSRQRLVSAPQLRTLTTLQR